MALDKKLFHPSEPSLTTAAKVVSALVWLSLICTAVIFGPFIALALLIAHGLFLANVRGNGVRISEQQFPDLHRMVAEAATSLGLSQPPAAYVVQFGGLLNAFATRFLSRNYVVIYSDLVEHCQTEKQLSFVVGHEVGHLAAGHLIWNIFLMPARLIPWLGTALRRSQEYTCDRCGHFVAKDLEESKRALAVLAAGGKLGQRTQLSVFAAQRADAGGFFMSAFEIASEYPFLCKRVAALDNIENPNAYPPVPRNAFGVFFGPFIGGGGGGGGSLIATLLILGIFAAIAIPNFQRFQERSRQQAATNDAPIATPSFDPTEDSEDASPAQEEAAEEEQREDLFAVRIPVTRGGSKKQRDSIAEMGKTMAEKLGGLGTLSDLQCSDDTCDLLFNGPNADDIAAALGPTLKRWKMLKKGSTVHVYADGRPEREDDY